MKKTRRVKSWPAVLCVLLALAVLCGCAEKQTQATPQERTPITVGCDSYEPYTYIEASGDFAGVDVELATEAFHRLGYEPQFQMIQWEERDGQLGSGTVDCLWSCFTMTGRENLYQWAGPYLCSRHVVVVQADSDIWTLADLKGRRVGVQATTKPESILLQNSDPRIPQVGQLYCCSSVTELNALLREGYVDAIVSHEESLKILTEKNGGKYRILDENFYTAELGVAFERGTHEELSRQLTQVLHEMEQDGTTERIVEKYGLDPQKAVLGGDAS